MASSEDHVETSRRHVSASTKNMHSPQASGTTGATLGDKVSTAFKEGIHQSESLRKNANSFFDNAIQPAAARDADRGATASDRMKNVPSVSGTEGHDVREGPAKGTGTVGRTERLGTGEGLRSDLRGVGKDMKGKFGGGGTSTT